MHEWASFSTQGLPGEPAGAAATWSASSSPTSRTRRPVEDVLWPDADYREVYAEAGLEVVAVHRPLGREGEPYPWVNETRIAPWVIYVLQKAALAR